MKKIWKLTSLIILPVIITISSFELKAVEVSAPTLSDIVSNAVTNNNTALISNLLSELEPKASAVCSEAPSSPTCIEYSAYVDALNQTNSNQ